MADVQAVAEGRFAAAYETVPDWARARLKKGIADVWSWLGSVAWKQEFKQTDYPAGARVLQRRQPRDWCLVVARPDAGPGVILGAVLPPLLSAVDEVAVLWLGHEEDLQMGMVLRGATVELHAVEPRHDHVGHEKINLTGMLTGKADGVSRRDGSQHGIAEPFQHHRDHFQNRRVVLHQ